MVNYALRLAVCLQKMPGHMFLTPLSGTFKQEMHQVGAVTSCTACCEGETGSCISGRVAGSCILEGFAGGGGMVCRGEWWGKRGEWGQGGWMFMHVSSRECIKWACCMLHLWHTSWLLVVTL